MSKSGLSTKDVNIGNGAVTPKLLQPGNRVIKIDKIHLEPFNFIPNSYSLILNCSGPAMGPDFEGFFIDPSNPSLGRHPGQIGKIKASEWAFADGSTKLGVPIDRDIEIMKFLKNLCVALNSSWMDEADGKYEDIETMVEEFNRDAPFEGKYINTCIAGREYMNKNGYPNFDLYFPRFSKNGKPFEPENTNPTGVVEFNEKVHIKRSVPKGVTSFDSDNIDSGTEEFIV